MHLYFAGHAIRSLFPFLLLASACSSAPPVPEAQAPQKYRGDLGFSPRAKFPAYPDKYGPRVCMDEGHHNLGVAERHYGPILDLLESDGYRMHKRKRKLTGGNLKDCDIVFVSAPLGHKDPTKTKLARQSAFTDAEIRALKKWVQNGGRLLVMTDQQPVSYASAKLLAAFGVYGSLNTVRDAEHPVEGFTDPAVISVEGDYRRREHPIIRGKHGGETVNKAFLFQGQALIGKPGAEYFLLRGDKARIGGANGERSVPARKFPALALSQKEGKGRLVVFGDASVFMAKHDLDLSENMGLNRPGSDNIQLALNVFHWLGGWLE